MKTPNVRFNEWSQKWETARGILDAEAVLRLWKSPVPANWQRDSNSWTGKLGYRHNHKEGPRGEQIIEKKLLEGFLHKIVDGDQHHPFLAVYQKMPLANQKQNQRIADVLGLVLHQETIHPVMVEVKVGANNCWFALVECLLQVRMGRANGVNIEAFLKKWNLPHSRAIWGMVLAPSDYFEKGEADGTMQHCRQLLSLLQEQTEARVAFASFDRLDKHSIRVKESNWS